MGTLAPFLADLAAYRPPSWPAGAILRAWRECDDAAEMIALLRRGAAVGVFETAEVSIWEKHGAVERWLFRLRYAGRFYRVDVHRADGAEGVRRCFPDFPDDWSSALEAQLAAKSPLDRLVSDLRNRRPISVDRATAQRAWEQHRDDPSTMLVILHLLGQSMPDLPAKPNLHTHSVAAYHAGRRRSFRAVLAAYPRIPLPD
jgi:hypothetical protein